MTSGAGLSADDLRALRRLNLLRAWPRDAAVELAALEARFDASHGARSRLAVYGSLAPGRPNHHLLSPLGGEWLRHLRARGELVERGWGQALGYPALRWSMDGPPVPVALLVSAALPAEWDRLDAFEGPDYRRELVPLFDRGGIAALANVYVSAV